MGDGASNRRRTLVAALGLAVVVAVSACSSGNDAAPSASTSAGSAPPQTLGARAQGDECQDPIGDLSSDARGTENLSDPAGIDLVSAKAKVVGDNLEVTYVTNGPIDGTVNPIFFLVQGDIGRVPDQTFELRAEPASSERWGVSLITFPGGRQRPSQALNVPVTVSGNTLSYKIPTNQLPPVATALWQFGSSAGVSDNSRVIDDCEPFAQKPGTTGTTPGPGATAPPTSVSRQAGTIGQTVTGADGSKVTVKSLAAPSTPNRTVLVHPLPTERLDAIEVEVCAGDKQAVEKVGERRFTLQGVDGRSFDPWAAPDYTNDPRFTAEQTLRPGECTSGWISYEVPKDAQITQVTYDVGGKGAGPFIVFTK